MRPTSAREAPPPESLVELLRIALQPLAAKEKVVPLHWLENVDGGWDGENYCYKCAVRAQKPGQHILGGEQWGTHGSDLQDFCEGCNVTLRVALTDYGVRNELGHFGERGVNSPRDAYELLNALDGYDRNWDAELRELVDRIALREIAARIKRFEESRR